MAFANLFVLIDDIATVLDDVAVLTKVAAKKTAGVLGDDLALNAGQVSGMASHRELPVVWAVAKGSFVNKLILVPVALLIAAFAPKLILPLLAIGGIYLCFEGVEKIWHSFSHHQKPQVTQEISEKIISPETDIVALEHEKIKGAIRTDFILSAEIIVISLGTVANANITSQIAVVSSIAILMTIGVYGLVAGIVKIDDLGIWLSLKKNKILKKIGASLLFFAPWLMRFLSVAGTAAMFLVGGGIIVHALPFGQMLEHFSKTFVWIPAWFSMAFINIVCGLIVGALAVIIFNLVHKLYKLFKKNG